MSRPTFFLPAWLIYSHIRHDDDSEANPIFGCLPRSVLKNGRQRTDRTRKILYNIDAEV